MKAVVDVQMASRREYGAWEHEITLTIAGPRLGAVGVPADEIPQDIRDALLKWLGSERQSDMLDERTGAGADVTRKCNCAPDLCRYGCHICDPDHASLKCPAAQPSDHHN